MTTGLLATALILGLRHGVDWDHIAAIADLSGTASDRRRGFRLSFLYAVGHALVVFALGCLAIIAGSAVPDGLDRWMGRVVGATLIWLGLWVLIELLRHGRDFRLRSRWMLVLDGTFAGLRRVARMADRRVIAIEHQHDHDHYDDHDDAHEHNDARSREHDREHREHEHREDEHRENERGDHRHDHDLAMNATSPTRDQREVSATVAVSSSGGAVRRALTRRTRHSHPHRHVLRLPSKLSSGSSPKTGTEAGAATAAGIGMLHGVGVESPTQIAVFVASTSVVGWTSGLAILASWCVGLIVANAGLAVLAGLGLLEARRNFVLYASVAVLVAIASIVMGTLYLFGLDVLPAISP